MDVFAVSGLSVETSGGQRIVDDLHFGLKSGEILAVVGESGSGKTTAALAMLAYARSGLKITNGSYWIGGIHQIDTTDLTKIRAQRGRSLSYVPQDPATALNPSLRIGQQIGVMLKTHDPARANPREIAEVLATVQLPTDKRFLMRFPHELSGGQQQRVAIAMALVCRPLVAVFDEPTTGLDVITQSLLLRQVATLREQFGLSLIYVTHDLSVVSQIADRVAVMYAGRLVELGPVRSTLRNPRHPYTAGLLAATPDYARPQVLEGIPGATTDSVRSSDGCHFAPRCSALVPRCGIIAPPVFEVQATRVRCFEWEKTILPATRPFVEPPAPPGAQTLFELKKIDAGYASRDVCHNVSLRIFAGECLALVGQSGSGKSTLSRVISGLHAARRGTILLDGASLAGHATARTRTQRRAIQMIFQNPRESLNPRQTILDSISRSAVVLCGLSRADANKRARDLLGMVRLDAKTGDRFPDELSGGQLQRAAIARALAAEPRLLVCDEVTSALDVSVQAAVLELLTELRKTLGLSMLFVTHDLGVVSSVAQRVVVFERGRIAECGTVDAVLQRPEASYTSELLAAVPSMSLIEAQLASCEARH